MPAKRGRIKPPNVAHLKPDKFRDYLTLGELSYKLSKDRDWIRKLERQDRLPQAKRVRIGEIEIRLYSPAQVEEIKEIFNRMRPGRPRGR